MSLGFLTPLSLSAWPIICLHLFFLLIPEEPLRWVVLLASLLITKKEYPSLSRLGGFPGYCFLPFRIWGTIYEKGPVEFSFWCLFKLSKHEKMPSSSFVRLVKPWWHWIPSKWRSPSFSFLGLVKCTRMDSPEGQTYITSICYPLQACYQK